jgi:transposase
MSKSTRRRFTPEQKAAMLRRHLVDKVAVSDICDEHSIQPSVLYGWQRQALGNLETALQDGHKTRSDTSAVAREHQRVQELEAKLARKN